MYPVGHKTERDTAAQIERIFRDAGILETVKDALTKPSWETFNSTSQSAHDNRNPACGSSLAATDIASFDPLFWLFNANWDRLWWRWQQVMQATTIWSFRSTFADPATGVFFSTPLNRLRPNFIDADKTIDLHALDVTYTTPASAAPVVAGDNFGSLIARRGFIAAKQAMMSVRVRDIDRLVILGSFRIVLLAKGGRVAV